MGTKNSKTALFTVVLRPGLLHLGISLVIAQRGLEIFRPSLAQKVFEKLGGWNLRAKIAAESMDGKGRRS